MSLAGAWWCRVDSNHRQRDYESRALPPELRHRTGRAPRRAPLRRRSYLAVCARAFSLRFFVRRLASATRFLLFKLSPENDAEPECSRLRDWVQICEGEVRLRVYIVFASRSPTPSSRRGSSERPPG